MIALSAFHLCDECVISKKKLLLAALLLIAQLFFMSAGSAAHCSIVTSPVLIFDQYDPMSKSFQDIETRIILQCESFPLQRHEDTAISIRVQNGEGNGIEQAMLNLENGDKLKFMLFRDSGRKMPWDTRNPLQILAGVQENKTFSIPIYGRIHANQNASKGHYQANLSLIITY